MKRRTSNLVRTLDRYAGIPAVALLSVLPKRVAPDWSTVERIGVLKTAAIGDTLLLASMLGALRKRFPSAELVLITGRDNAAAAPLLAPLFDRHAVVSVRSPLAAIRALRALRLDVLLECGPWPRVDALITALSGASFRVGFRVRAQARHFALDRVVDHSPDVHQIENFNRLAAAVGATEPGPGALAAPRKLPPGRLPAGRFAVFHPWSGGYMGHVKEWPTRRWTELAANVHERFGIDILISGASADVERSRCLADELRVTGARVASIAGEFTLLEMADVLAAAAFVVSVNTGIMHLSALVGAPTVSLEGPVPPRRWGPVGPRVRSVVSTAADCGYLDLGFEYAGHRLDVMDEVPVDAVVEAIVDLIDTSEHTTD